VAFLQALLPAWTRWPWPPWSRRSGAGWIGDFTAQITGASVLNLINETSA